MAKPKADESLVQSILGILKEETLGLEVSEIIVRLNGVDGNLSARSFRNLLSRLEREKKVIKQKRQRKTPGAPPFVYFHPDNTPRQLGFFDEMPGVESYRIQTKTEFEKKQLDPEELKKEERAVAVLEGDSVLERIAESHVVEEAYARAIIEIAPRLAAENPVEMLILLARWTVADLNRLGDIAQEAWRRGDTDKAEEVSADLEIRLMWARRYFQRLLRLDRGLEDVAPVMLLPAHAKKFRSGERADLDEDEARRRLELRVRGDRIADILTLPTTVHTSVVGTDASVADIFLEHARGSFIPPDPVSVMTAAAAMKTRSQDATYEYQDFDIFPDQLREYKEHTAAVNGLVISPVLKNILPEADFKHSRLASMDLRQYHQDLRTAQKHSNWRPVGESPMLGIKPKVSMILRDGRLLPLVHRIKDFEDDGLYGQIVRNQIEQFAMTVTQIFSRVLGDIVYGSAVKSPEMSWLAPLVFWYLHINEVKVNGRPVVSDNEVARHPFPDTAVSHLLFLGLMKQKGSTPDNSVFVTFRVLRRFSDIAVESLPPVVEEKGIFRLINEDSLEDWEKLIEQRVKEHLRQHKEGMLEPEDYSPFIYLCSRVGVSMVYAAPCAAYVTLLENDAEGAHFLIPRLEVIAQMDDLGREQGHLESMLSWLSTGGCQLDDNHTQTRFDTGDREGGLPVLVPDVVVLAHEAATFARDKLSEEIQDEIRARIARLREWLRKIR